MTVSIILPCLNHYEYTKMTLDNILKYTDLEYELIIVNDGSTDDTVNVILEYSPDHYIEHSTNLGFSRSINDGVKVSSGEYICVFNNDIQVSQGWLEPLVETISKDMRIAWVSSYLIHENKKEFDRLARSILPNTFTKWGYGGPWLILKQAYLLVDGLDESFYPVWYEDFDLMVKIVKAGFNFGVQNNSLALHYHGITRQGELKNRTDDSYYERNRLLFNKRYGLPENEQPHPRIDWDYLLKTKGVRLKV